MSSIYHPRVLDIPTKLQTNDNLFDEWEFDF